MSLPDIAGLNRTISPRDALYPVYAKNHEASDYFTSALRQMDELDELLRQIAGRPLAAHGSVVDYACHYGRMARCLRARLPGARIVAADLDPQATVFCQEQFGCEPLRVGWSLEAVPAAAEHDLVICSSLLTHTPFAYLERVLALWERMLAPGGTLVFTYLGARYVDQWLAGGLDHYTLVAPEVRREQAAVFRRQGHAFVSIAGEYGMGFVAEGFVGYAIGRFPSLRLQHIRAGTDNTFGQDLAVVSKCV